MKIAKLTIIVPCYNEKNTIAQVIKILRSVDLYPVKKEIILVDDGSDDGTTELIKKEDEDKVNEIFIFHHKNKGKGSAIRTALKITSGDFVIIQDADLEYDPNEIKHLLDFAQDRSAKVVYGSRNINRNKKSYLHFYYGGILLTKIGNLLFGLKLTDLTTGYKLIQKRILEDLKLEERGFGFCAELTAKIAKRRIKIFEFPISYEPRSFKEGKKIRVSD
jgi:dolichol-phosphate mannosyltransferase